MLALGQEAGDDPGNAAAGVERRAGDLAHEAHAAAAVDKADAVLGKGRPSVRAASAYAGLLPLPEPQ